MPDRPSVPERGRRSLRRLLPVALALLVIGPALLLRPQHIQAEPTPPVGIQEPVPASVADPAPSPTSHSPSPVASPGADRQLAPNARPVRLRVPSIGVDAPMIELGLEPDRTLEVPDNTVDTGWYTGGPRPGELGPAVIAGHVDSKAGPGVFFRLRELQPGAHVEVAYDDGSVVAFVITEVARYAKDAFPTARVYGDTAEAELRLITCGGTFDRGDGHYRDNVIAFATRDSPPAGATPAGSGGPQGDG